MTRDDEQPKQVAHTHPTHARPHTRAHARLLTCPANSRLTLPAPVYRPGSTFTVSPALVLPTAHDRLPHAAANSSPSIVGLHGTLAAAPASTTTTEAPTTGSATTAHNATK